ncbi:MAG: phospholipase D family protein [Candidatus Omnitrophota bacterium]
MNMKRRIFLILFLGLAIVSISRAYCLGPKISLPAKFQDLHIAEKLTYSNSPFNYFISDSQDNASHYVNVLNNGDDALLARLHLIRQAQKSILIKTFIWKTDETSRLIAYELIKAAKRGVKVKIIIDSFTLPKKLHLITLLTVAHPNIEVKLYNPVSRNAASSKIDLVKKTLFNFRSLNQRMHNKAFIIDDRIGITGGRNYENDYYDRGNKRNFKDCDVLAIGPVVKEMTDSFREYWSYPLSVWSKDMRDIQSLIESDRYKQYLPQEGREFKSMFEELWACEADKQCIKQRLIDTSYKVKGVKFVTDSPGKRLRMGKYNVTRTTHELYRFLEQAQDYIIMQTPYLIIGNKCAKYFKQLAGKKPKVEFFVSSNSLASADHVHAYAFSYKNKKEYLNSFRWQIFELKLLPEDADLMITPIKKEQRHKDYITCIHSKIYVVDGKKTWIGSFNLDPRSANLNTESGVIIDDEKLAQDTEKNIRRDMAGQNSWVIGRRKQVPVIDQFSGLIGSVMKLMPVADIWPFVYSGSFELKPEKPAVPFFHKDFYTNYKYIGPFPKVQSTEKEIKTRLIKAFFGPIQPLI